MLVFVFGSNIQGVHGAGAAKHALDFYGAIPGRPCGRMGVGTLGSSFGIITKDLSTEKAVSLDFIKDGIGQFRTHAKAHPEDIFLFTAIGCGLAGLNVADIKDLVWPMPENVFVSPRFLPNGV